MKPVMFWTNSSGVSERLHSWMNWAPFWDSSLNRIPLLASTPTGNPLIDTVRYQTRAGWDAVHGYGRINTYEMLRALEAGRIPPEAMIDGPLWFDVLPVTGTVPIDGYVAAERADSYDYRVEWAPGAQPPAHPLADSWTVIEEQTGLTAPLSGELAQLDLAAVAAALPGGADTSAHA